MTERAVKFEVMLAAPVAERTIELRAAVLAMRVNRAVVAVGFGRLRGDLIGGDGGGNGVGETGGLE